MYIMNYSHDEPGRRGAMVRGRYGAKRNPTLGEWGQRGVVTLKWLLPAGVGFKSCEFGSQHPAGPLVGGSPSSIESMSRSLIRISAVSLAIPEQLHPHEDGDTWWHILPLVLVIG